MLKRFFEVLTLPAMIIGAFLAILFLPVILALCYVFDVEL